MPEDKPDRHASTHAAILEAGSRRFREKGYAATSLRDIMGDCELTIGGFYSHFASKSELYAACFAKAASGGSERLFSGVGPEGYLDSVGRYLSDRHVTDKSGGCPLAAMLSELDQFQKENPSPLVQGYVETFSRELTLHGADRDRVLGLLALMLGALTLARAVQDGDLRRKILRQSLESASNFHKQTKARSRNGNASKDRNDFGPHGRARPRGR